MNKHSVYCVVLLSVLSSLVFNGVILYSFDAYNASWLKELAIAFVITVVDLVTLGIGMLYTFYIYAGI